MQPMWVQSFVICFKELAALKESARIKQETVDEVYNQVNSLGFTLIVTVEGVFEGGDRILH